MADNTELDAGSGGVTLATASLTFSGDTAQVQVVGCAILSGSEGSWVLSQFVGGAGAVAAGVQRVTLASDDPGVALLTTIDADTSAIKTAVEVMDDWDESDRAKVNPIVGQAGIAAGAGAVGVTVPRVTLASDDPGVALLTTIDSDTDAIKTAVETIDNAISGSEILIAGGATQTNDVKVTLDGEAVVLGAGSAAIGKLAANTGVDIGDVDVTSMPGAAAEAAPLPGAFVVVAGDDGTDTHPLQTDASGNLKVNVSAGSAAGTEYTEDDAAAANPDGGMPVMVRADSPAGVTSTNGDVVAQRATNYGAAFVQILDSSGNFVDSFGGAGGTSSADDADFVAGTTLGTQVQGVYESSPTSVTDGDVGQIGITSTRQVRTSATQEGTWTVDCNGSNVTVDNASIAITHAALTELAGAIDTQVQVDIVADGAGLATDAKLDDIIADTAAIQTAVEIMDDWDESDRAKVNLIAGQAGIAGGTGVDGATVPRITLATNVALPAGTNNIGDVDVLSVVPGTAATNLGKARASAVGATDTGVAPLAVRNDDLADLAGADADYTPLQVDNRGALYVNSAAAEPKQLSGVAAGGTPGADEMIPSVSGKKLLILALSLFSTSTTTNTVYVDNVDNNLLGNSGNGIALSLDADGDTVAGFILPYNPGGWFKTDAVTEAVTLNTSAAQDIIWCITYIETD